MRGFSKFIILASISIATALSMVGCSDNPKAKAAKEANKAVDEAIRGVEVYRYGTGSDYDAAYKKVESAFKQVKAAGGDVDSVYLVAGQLSLAKGQKTFSKISDFENDVIGKVKAVGKEILNYVSLEKKHKTSAMLDQISVSESQALELVIAGGAELKGITDKLSDATKELSELEAQLALYHSNAKESQAKADAIQSEADNLLRKAELLSGDERLALEKEAYSKIKGSETVPGKIYYSADVQKNIDLAKMVQGRIDIVKPLIAKLRQDEARIAKRISVLSDKDRKAAAIKDLAVLESDINDVKSKISSNLDELSVAIERYEDHLKATVDAYIAAQRDYAKVRSRSVKNLAKVSSADVGSGLADVYSSCVLFYSRLENYLQSYISIDSDIEASRFEELAHKVSANLDQARTDMISSYDKTLETLEQVMSSGAGKELRVRAVREYLVLAYQRLQLAQDARDKELFDGLIAKIEDYKKIAIEADPYFSKSLPAKLLSRYGIEFKTQEEKLQEKYAALREEFAQAGSLEEAERRETLISLVDQLYNLDRPKNAKIFDDLVKYILNTYKADLVAIKTANQEMPSLEIFGETLQAQENEEGGDYDSSTDMFGEPNSN